MTETCEDSLIDLGAVNAAFQAGVSGGGQNNVVQQVNAVVMGDNRI